MTTNNTSDFIKNLTRTSSVAGISKRQVKATLMEHFTGAFGAYSTLYSALLVYSHKEREGSKNITPIIHSREYTADDANHGDIINKLKYFKLFEGFSSLGEYRTYFPSMPGGSDEHIICIAYHNSNKVHNFEADDIHLSFKDAEHLHKFGQFMSRKGAFITTPDNRKEHFTITFGDECNRPIARISFMQDDPKVKPLDAFKMKFICGDDKFVEEIKDILNECLQINSSSARLTTIIGVSPTGLETTEEDLDPDTVKLAGDCFYPWMKGTSIEEYFKDFLESDANVLVFYGPPGTGKSSMLTTAIVRLGLNALMTSNSSVASNPEFLSRLGQKLAGEDGKYDLVIVEDGDSLMVPREKGNDALSQLLNSTSGISQKLRFKLVLTSNQEDNSNIDPALLRHGRCYDRMMFGALKQTEADAVVEYLGRPPVNLKEGTRMTLAQLINSDVRSTASLYKESSQIVAPRFPLMN